MSTARFDSTLAAFAWLTAIEDDDDRTQAASLLWLGAIIDHIDHNGVGDPFGVPLDDVTGLVPFVVRAVVGASTTDFIADAVARGHLAIDDSTPGETWVLAGSGEAPDFAEEG